VQLTCTEENGDTSVCGIGKELKSNDFVESLVTGELLGLKLLPSTAKEEISSISDLVVKTQFFFLKTRKYFAVAVTDASGTEPKR